MRKEAVLTPRGADNLLLMPQLRPLLLIQHMEIDSLASNNNHRAIRGVATQPTRRNPSTRYLLTYALEPRT
jgi:hypothetical protein